MEEMEEMEEMQVYRLHSFKLLFFKLFLLCGFLGNENHGISLNYLKKQKIRDKKISSNSNMLNSVKKGFC